MRSFDHQFDDLSISKMNDFANGRRSLEISIIVYKLFWNSTGAHQEQGSKHPN